MITIFPLFHAASFPLSSSPLIPTCALRILRIVQQELRRGGVQGQLTLGPPAKSAGSSAENRKFNHSNIGIS
jgi:hypothetical protein